MRRRPTTPTMPSRRDFLAGATSLGLATTAGCLGVGDGGDVFSAGTDADSDWPMPRHDPANTAFAPDAVAPRDGAAVRWQNDAVGLHVQGLAVADGTLYVPTTDALRALDTASGEEQWRFAPEDDPLPSPPIVHDGTVFVVTREAHTLHAVDAESGEALWSRASDRDVATGPHLLDSQLVDSPLVLVGDDAGVLTAVDPETGEVAWSVDAFGAVTAVSYSPHGLFVGTAGGEVYAYYSQQGGEPTESWRRKVGGKIEGIVPTDNGVIVSTFGGPLTNLNDGLQAGTTRWEADEDHSGSPAVHAGSWLYSTGYDGLSSVREYDENLHWQVDGEFGNAPPVAAGDRLYVPGPTAVHAFDLAGGLGGRGFTFDAKRWSHSLGEGSIRTMAVGDGALFVARAPKESDDASLFCLEEA